MNEWSWWLVCFGWHSGGGGEGCWYIGRGSTISEGGKRK